MLARNSSLQFNKGNNQSPSLYINLPNCSGQGGGLSESISATSVQPRQLSASHICYCLKHKVLACKRRREKRERETEEREREREDEGRPGREKRGEAERPEHMQSRTWRRPTARPCQHAGRRMEEHPGRPPEEKEEEEKKREREKEQRSSGTQENTPIDKPRGFL